MTELRSRSAAAANAVAAAAAAASAAAGIGSHHNQCRLCSQRFPSQEELDKHNFLCHDPAGTSSSLQASAVVLSSFENTTQQRQLPPATEAKRAASQASSRPRVTCQRCQRTFARRSNLNAHLRFNCPMRAAGGGHGGGGGLASFACQICGSRYSSRSSYNRHMRMHRYRQQTQPQQHQHHNQHHHHHHHHQHHHNQNQKQQNYGRTSSAQDRQTQAKFSCAICRDSAPNELSLILHLSNKHNLAGQLHLCSVCRQVCVSRVQLWRHAATSAGCGDSGGGGGGGGGPQSARPFGCPDCDRGFASRCQLSAHAAAHAATAPRPHRCPLCPGVEFRWRFQLVDHCGLHLLVGAAGPSFAE